MSLSRDQLFDRIFAVIVLIWTVGFWSFAAYVFGLIFGSIGPIELFSELILEGGEDSSMIFGFLFITPLIWLFICSFGSLLMYRLVFRRRSRLLLTWKILVIGVLVGHGLFLFGYWFGLLGFLFAYPATVWSLGREVLDVEPSIRLFIAGLVLLGPSLGLQSYLLAYYSFFKPIVHREYVKKMQEGLST